MREILFRGKRLRNGDWEYGGCEVIGNIYDNPTSPEKGIMKNE